MARARSCVVPGSLLAVGLVIGLGTAQAQVVERVIDGDTIVVQGVGTVRLIGVDTPETVDPRKPVEAFGKQASEFTRRLVDGKVVRLEYDAERTDRYGRTLAYVYLPDGTFVNAEIVRQGYGHAYTQFPFKFLEQFRALERDAREAGRGLWAKTSPSAATAPTDQAVGDTIVYVTRTGSKYHQAGCRYLARSQIPMPLKEAAARYGPCSVCSPPTLAVEEPVAPGAAGVKAAPAPPPPAPASPGRCQAITKKGTQCSRQAKPGSLYCWQHGG